MQPKRISVPLKSGWDFSQRAAGGSMADFHLDAAPALRMHHPAHLPCFAPTVAGTINLFSTVHVICSTARAVGAFNALRGGKRPSVAARLAANAVPTTENCKDNVYVVMKGRRPGVYQTWEECHEQVHGFSGALYKKADPRTLPAASLMALRASQHGEDKDEVQGEEDDNMNVETDALSIPETIEPTLSTKRTRPVKTKASQAKAKRSGSTKKPKKAASKVLDGAAGAKVVSPQRRRGRPRRTNTEVKTGSADPGTGTGSELPSPTAATQDSQAETNEGGGPPAERPRRTFEKLEIYIDGAARGNPGLASFGVYVTDEAGQCVAEVARRIGKATNNVAEWEAACEGLRLARELGAREVRLRSDSLLVVRQLEGSWKVKSPALAALHARATARKGKLERVEVEWVPRERNAEADRLANHALDFGDEEWKY